MEGATEGFGLMPLVSSYAICVLRIIQFYTGIFLAWS